MILPLGIVRRQVRAVGGELFAKPGDCPGRFDRPGRHALLNQLEDRSGPRLTGPLLPRPPHRPRGETREQHEDGEAGVEHAHRPAAGEG